VSHEEHGVRVHEIRQKSQKFTHKYNKLETEKLSNRRIYMRKLQGYLPQCYIAAW